MYFVVTEGYSLVAQLVRDGVREHDAVVLVDGATAVRLAHAGHMRHAQSAANKLTQYLIDISRFGVTSFVQLTKVQALYSSIVLNSVEHEMRLIPRPKG